MGEVGTVPRDRACAFPDARPPGRSIVLAMIDEETVAHLAASEVYSYQHLPRLVYQIQTKSRDDPRPKAGLVRPQVHQE